MTTWHGRPHPTPTDVASGRIASPLDPRNRRKSASVRDAVSPITFTQHGIITRCELAKILIITSDGVLEVAFPLTDDDRRDMEIHLRGEFARNLAFQVKSTLHPAHRFKAYQLSMFFSVPKDRLISHPNFWYFFGYFDIKTMTFANPVFIVPSADVHSRAAPRLDGDR